MAHGSVILSCSVGMLRPTFHRLPPSSLLVTYTACHHLLYLLRTQRVTIFFTYAHGVSPSSLLMYTACHHLLYLLCTRRVTIFFTYVHRVSPSSLLVMYTACHHLLYLLCTRRVTIFTSYIHGVSPSLHLMYTACHHLYFLCTRCVTIFTSYVHGLSPSLHFMYTACHHLYFLCTRRVTIFCTSYIPKKIGSRWDLQLWKRTLHQEVTEAMFHTWPTCVLLSRPRLPLTLKLALWQCFTPAHLRTSIKATSTTDSKAGTSAMFHTWPTCALWQCFTPGPPVYFSQGHVYHRY